MSAPRMIQNTLVRVCSHMHAGRAASLLAAVNGLLRHDRLTLTGLGRSLGGPVAHRHSIKRVDRLLGNKHLHEEVVDVYARLFHHVLARQLKPIILVDWTDVGSGRFALVAAVPIWGRALPIYAEVHLESVLGTKKVHDAFLATFKNRIVPEYCRPVIVSDAGFGNPWFAAVQNHGWDYVGRMSTCPHVLPDGADPEVPEAWKALPELVTRKPSKAKDLGRFTVAKSNPFPTRLVTFKAPPAGRKGSTKVNRRGVHPNSSSNKKYRKRAKDPWILATSLEDVPSRIADYYRTRMRIEEAFRDAKSHRFGWSFEDARCRMPVAGSKKAARDLNRAGSARLEVLLLIAALGMLAANLVGLALEQAGRHRDYQANTIAKRRVLSLFYLGVRALRRDNSQHHLAGTSLRKALKTLRNQAGDLQVLEPLEAS